MQNKFDLLVLLVYSSLSLLPDEGVITFVVRSQPAKTKCIRKTVRLPGIISNSGSAGLSAHTKRPVSLAPLQQSHLQP